AALCRASIAGSQVSRYLLLRRTGTSGVVAVAMGAVIPIRLTGANVVCRAGSEAITASMGDGTDVERVDRGPSAVVVLMDAGAVVLVQQWRDAAGAETVERVQERLEPGETPLDAAIRGVREECALHAT